MLERLFIHFFIHIFAAGAVARASIPAFAASECGAEEQVDKRDGQMAE